MNAAARHIWRELIEYTLERSCIFTSLWWGAWMLAFQPISSGAATMRGTYLMNEAFSFLPFASDWAWGVCIALPAGVQMYCALTGRHLHLRGGMALFRGTVFLFVSILIGMANWGTTGLAMYGGIAIAELACYAQLTHARMMEVK